MANKNSIGRPGVVTRVDIELVLKLRSTGRSWREIAMAHPEVPSCSGRQVRPSSGSIRRAFAAYITNQQAKETREKNQQ
jgi:hypothetical protein